MKNGKRAYYIDDVYREDNALFSNPEYWNYIVGNYRITYDVVRHASMIGGIKNDDYSPLFPQKEWALVFFDQTACVFVKRIPAYQELIAAREFSCIRPYEFKFLYMLKNYRQCFAEVERNIAECPRNARAWYWKAFLYAAQKPPDTPHVLQALDEALRIAPDFKDAKKQKKFFLKGAK